MFASICMMNTLKNMSPNELLQTKERLAQYNTIIQMDDEYITLVYQGIQTMFGREYKSWEIVKNGFTNDEIAYLHSIGFQRPDQHAFQAWGELAA